MYDQHSARKPCEIELIFTCNRFKHPELKISVTVSFNKKPDLGYANLTISFTKRLKCSRNLFI